MKKYLLTSILSLSLSIVMIIHLYKTKDIEWVDTIVERSTAALGIEPKIVTEKIERKTKERKIAQTLTPANLPSEKREVDLATEADNIDSVSVSVPDLKVEKKARRLFNADISPKVVDEEIKKADSIAEPQVIEAKVPKRKLFNASIEPKESIQAETTHTNNLVFFKAEVNTPQRFNDDQEITFRTSERVTIGSSVIPEKIVFSAKANVFDGRIHFVLKSINDVPVKGENFKEQLPGMPIRSEFRLNESYFLSEGFPVVFGVRL